jgi:hypothetical protein
MSGNAGSKVVVAFSRDLISMISLLHP